jgi:outer membrane receptor protein involved in Fe transport
MALKHKLLLATTMLGGLTMFAPTVTMAQTAPAAGADSTAVEEIVVTGSRIRRDTFNSPVAMSVISGEQIRESGNTSIAEALLDVPSINANTNGQNSSSSLYLSGQARADIRGLGATRTLVLMDGRRIVFSDASSPAVDLNLIPSMMVERIETVAGGASAVYGSEAIAGVVNVLMKKKYDGIEFDAQVGVSGEGDGRERRLSFLAGRQFLDGRLNVLVGGEASHTDPVFQRDRDWAFPGIRRNSSVSPQTVIPTSRSNVQPTATFQLLGGGVGAARAVTLDYRDPSKVVRLSAPCSTATVQPTCQDEALIYTGIFNALQGENDRKTFRTYVDYEVNDNIKAFVDVSYAKVKGYGYFQPPFSSAAGGGTMPVSLKGDNAYLAGSDATATALRNEWLAAGKTLTQGSTAQVGKFWVEFGGRDVATDRDTTRLVGGMEGRFNVANRDFNWDWYAQYGETSGETTSFNVPQVARVQQATDAVLLNGQIVCRDATARANGCQPWDLIHGASAEAVAWTNAQSTTEQKVKQTVLAANIATDLFTLPAGAVGVAAGLEYRKEESSFEQDALGASGALFFNAIGKRAGKYDVREAYGEIRVPLLKNVILADELTVEFAGRAADYSTIGHTTQYEMRALWSPVRDIRFRANQGKAVRAPNIVELFSPQSVNFTTAAIDPCDKDAYAGASATQKAARNQTCAAAIAGWNPATFVSNIGTGRPSLQLTQGGNPQLGPETANTYQLGVVVEPRWIPRLSVSLDFFKYNITDQVGTIPINTLFQQLCYDSTQAYASNPFCALITRETVAQNGGKVGDVRTVSLTNQNVAKVKVEGWDASVAYGLPLEDVFKRDLGSLAFRVDATWMYRWALQGLPGQAYTQQANNISNATPEWKAQGSVQWTYDKVAVGWTTRYIGSMASTNAFNKTQLDPYYTGDYFSHDVRVKYEVDDKLQIRGGIQNVTDKHPPYLPETLTGTGTGSSSYDNRGRFFYAGVTMRY